MDGWDQKHEADLIPECSETSGVIRSEDPRDYVELGDNTGTGLQMVKSVSMAWTDEKHSSYLSSIEASFVKQLHNHEYPLMHFHGRLSRSRRQKLIALNSVSSNGNNDFSSGQFKVHHRGCWEKPSIERACSQLDIENETCLLLANPWIQRLRPASTGRGKEATLPIAEKGQSHGSPTRLRKLPPCHPGIYHRDSVSSNTEMSDQNFVNEESEDGEQLNSSCDRMKRVRAAPGEVLSEDQTMLSRMDL